MRNPARTPFGAIFRTEVMLNSKRVLPYAMAALCGGNALLWWGWGPGVGRGWAPNSDHFVAGALPVFSFMTLPLFTAVFMADSVIRDFRTGVTPLIFSTPVGRAEYLLGKFSGNFFTLACCQAAFPATLFALQWFRRPGMIVGPVRFAPYVKHFLLVVVLAHLLLATIYFAVGTLTRSARLVYGLAVAFYPLYAAYHLVLLNRLPARWQVALDPLLMDWQREATRGRSAEWFNQAAVAYGGDVIANRAVVVLAAAACLALLCARFWKAERSGGGTRGQFSLLELSAGGDRLYNDAASYAPARAGQTAVGAPGGEADAPREKVAVPEVNVAGAGPRAGLAKLAAALGVEFRLLRAERGLIVFAPLAVFVSTLELAFYPVVPEVTYSGAYASGTARALVLLLAGMIVFYTGEALDRDRELRVEPLLWSAPAPNSALLLSKFCATVIAALALAASVALAAAAVQLLRGHGPLEPSAYLKVYALILVPTILFTAAASVFLNVALRDKHLTYAASVGLGVALFYFYGRVQNNWLYNPALYRLWTYADLSGDGGAHSRLLLHRLYCLALAGLFLSLAHLWFPRKDKASGRGAGGRLGGAAWPLLLACASAAAAVAAGVAVSSAH